MGDTSPNALIPRPGSVNRRIGRREPIADLWIDWHPTSKGRRRRRGARRAETALVLDLSLSGARITVVESETLNVGARAGIGLPEGAGTVAVRRVEPGIAGSSIYGIQFLTLEPGLREAIHARVAERQAALTS